jgi:hypothetical protein
LGCAISDGGSRTVSVARLVVTEPHALAITQSYVPASAIVAAAIAKTEPVSPEITDPFLRHWNVGDVPLTFTVKDAGCPVHLVNAIGCADTETGLLTIRVAPELVTAPQELVITQSYVPAAATSAASIASVAPVAPGMGEPSLRH